jgi:hypothetical protein
MRKLLVGVCAAMLALGGCGGGSDTASTAPGTTEATTAPQPSQQSTAGQAKAKQTDGSSAKDGEKSVGSSPQSASTPGTVKVPPISSAPTAGSKAPAQGVATVKGGDNSVQAYGVESDSSARTEAAIALQAYLNARSEEDWGSACSYLAQRPKEQLEKLTQQAKGGEGLGSCAAVMEALGKGTPQAARITEVLSLRGGGDVPGDPSYLIFEGPPASTLYSMPMYLEGTGWKVGLALPSELPV